jgi:hypothetical protein
MNPDDPDPRQSNFRVAVRRHASDHLGSAWRGGRLYRGQGALIWRLPLSIILVGVLLAPALIADEDRNLDEVLLLAWVFVVVGCVAKFVLFA